LTKPRAATLKLKDYLLKERPPTIESAHCLELRFGLQYTQVARQLQSAGYVKDKASPVWHAPLATAVADNNYVLTVTPEAMAEILDEHHNAIKQRYKELGMSHALRDLKAMLAVLTTEDQRSITVTEKGVTRA
jgi:hypothetical protein